MKELTTGLSFFFLCFFCQAQNNTTNTTDQRSQYLYENFSKGNVLMKSGTVEEALLNYNTADQSIVFEKTDGSVLTLTGLETIDTIYFRNKRFIPGPDGLIYEVITNNFPMASLYVTYTNKMRPAIAATDPGGTTHKDAAEVSNTVSNVYMLRPYKGDFMIEIQKSYWLLKAKQIYKASSARQFEKVFPHKETAIHNYIADNHISFTIEEDLIKLTTFCNQHM